MTPATASSTPASDAYSDAAVIDGVDVDAIAAAVTGCSGVDALDGGAVGTVATYLPGRRVAGVRVADEAVTVQVRSTWNVPIVGVATAIRDALRPLVGGRRVDVTVSDIATPREHAGPEAAQEPEAIEAPPTAVLPPIAPAAKPQGRHEAEPKTTAPMQIAEEARTTPTQDLSSKTGAHSDGNTLASSTPTPEATPQRSSPA